MPPIPPADDDVEIRRADLADGDQVGRLAERVYRQGGWADEAYSPVLLDGRSRIEQAEVLVAEAADAILGTATVARPGRDRTIGRLVLLAYRLNLDPG